MKPYLSHGYSNLLYSFLITPAQTINQDWYYDLSLAPAGFWAHVRNDGGDIRVFKRDGITQVPREVSGFNFAGQQGALYIGDAAGETAFYVCYGNPALTEPAPNSTYGKYAVWESAAQLVMHLEDPNDATVNQNNGSLQGVPPPASAAAQIRNGYSFNGLGGYIDTADINAVDGSPTLTVMCWVKSVAFVMQDAFVVKWNYIGDGCFGLQTGIAANNTVQIYIATALGDDGSGCSIETTNNVLIDNQWNQVCLVFDGNDATRVKLYVNGVAVALTQISGAAPATLTVGSAATVKLGRFGGALSRFFNGIMDEVRLLTRALTAVEVANAFANQNAPAAFWTTGIETRAICQYAL
jgi:hypothetical protein